MTIAIESALKPGFQMIVTIVAIVAIVENGCDDPDDHIGNTNFLFSADRDDQDRHTRGDRNHLYLHDRGDQVTIENLMETTSAAIVTIETIGCSLQCISFLDLHHLQNGVFRISQQRSVTSGTYTNFI